MFLLGLFVGLVCGVAATLRRRERGEDVRRWLA